MQEFWRSQARITLTSHRNEGIQVRLGPADVLVVCELVRDGAVT